MHCNTIESYKQKLKMMHMAIKANLYREDHIRYSHYGEGYYEAVYKFAETFYHLTKDVQKNTIQGKLNDEDKKLAMIAKNCCFIHDFYAACNRSENAIISYRTYGKSKSIDIIHKEELMLELAISCVHTYIETGMINKYPFKYHGEVLFMKWDENRQEYVTNINGKITNLE